MCEGSLRVSSCHLLVVFPGFSGFLHPLNKTHQLLEQFIEWLFHVPASKIIQWPFPHSVGYATSAQGEEALEGVCW